MLELSLVWCFLLVGCFLLVCFGGAFSWFALASLGVFLCHAPAGAPEVLGIPNGPPLRRKYLEELFFGVIATTLRNQYYAICIAKEISENSFLGSYVNFT